MKKKIKRIIIGSANFGNHYGIKEKKLSLKSIHQILKYANKIGVKLIDTAQSYGNSERDIGKLRNKYNLEVITKLPSLKKKLKNTEFENLLIKSNNALNSKFKYLLFHDFKDFVRNNYYNPKKIIKFKGIYFKKLGVSVYSPEEFLKCLKFKNLDCIQIPFNILDYRWNTIDFMKIKKKNKNLEIHARSIFLKGILPKRIDLLPNWFKDKIKLRKKINDLEKLYKINFLKISFLYVYEQKWIDKIVIGLSKKKQLENIYNFIINKKKINFNNNTFKFIPKKILMPKKW